MKKNAGSRSEPGKRRVLVVDDHPIVRKGVAYVINREPDMTVCAELADGQSVLPTLSDMKPDAVVLDLFLKDVNGMDLLKEIKKKFSHVPVLVLSMQNEAIYAERVLRAGGKGYVSKDDMLENVVDALRKILAGKVYAGEAVKAKLLDDISKGSPKSDAAAVEDLSDRELEVFQLLGLGFSTRRIATRWNRSVKTVETYRAHLKRKLNLSDSAELVRRAVQWMERQKTPH